VPGKPESDGCDAEDHCELDKVHEVCEEPMEARDTWMLDESDEPGLAVLVLVMCVCPPS
jgi:hypothetical protein